MSQETVALAEAMRKHVLLNDSKAIKDAIQSIIKSSSIDIAFDYLYELYLNHTDDAEIVQGIAMAVGIPEIIDNRMFNGLILLLLDYNNPAVTLETVKAISNSKEKQRYLYELEHIDISNKPAFLINYISGVIENIKAHMQKHPAYLTREQTRMKCGECGAFTDFKCVACGKGLCPEHIEFDGPEGYWCKECHTIKIEAIRKQFIEDNEDKERVTSIKIRKPSKP